MPAGQARPIPVGEAARRAGVPVSTLHFYEREGLLYAERGPGGQRRYTPRTLDFLHIVKVARDLGFSLAEIKALCRPLPRSRLPTPSECAAAEKVWLDRIEEQIGALEALRDAIGRHGAPTQGAR